MKQYTRQQVKERLLAAIANKDSIIIAGTGSGMSARQAEIGGADLVGLYSTSFFRMEGIYGMPSFAPVIDNNQIVLNLVRTVAPALKEVPVIAGIMANDPTKDLGKLYDELKSIGCSCIMNFPLTGDHSGRFREALEDVGLGITREMEMLRIAHEKDMFTIGYAFNKKDAVYCASTGIDLVILHMGRTKGGDMGSVKRTDDFGIDYAIEQINEIYAAVKEVNSDVLVFAHGGPISSPDEAEYMFQHTDVTGFLGASSCERIPIEKPQAAAISELKLLKIK